jgi:hypothetical protein
LLDQARAGQQQGDIQQRERLMLQAVENAHANMTRLKSGREVDIATGTFGTLASFYIDQSRCVDAEPLLLEEKGSAIFSKFRAGLDRPCAATCRITLRKCTARRVDRWKTLLINYQINSRITCLTVCAPLIFQANSLYPIRDKRTMHKPIA